MRFAPCSDAVSRARSESLKSFSISVTRESSESDEDRFGRFKMCLIVSWSALIAGGPYLSISFQGIFVAALTTGIKHALSRDIFVGVLFAKMQALKVGF